MLREIYGGSGATGGTSGAGGSGGTAGTGGSTSDAGADAPDAPADVAPDSPDDGGADASDGGELNVLYATFDGVLLTINPETGEEHDIGFVRTAGDAGVTYLDPAMTWSGIDRNTALMITSYDVTTRVASQRNCSGT